MMRPILTSEWLKLSKWCRQYQKYSDIMKQPYHVRFGIGIYQIGQSMGWSADLQVADQSLCAACLHFIMVAEALELPLESHPLIPQDIEEINCRFDSHKNLLRHICRAQQMIIYRLHSEGSNRKSRYKKEVLTNALAEIISQLMCQVPADLRARLIYDEMAIITKDIVVK